MTKIKPLEITLEDLQKHFSDFTLEELDSYEKWCHDGDINTITNNYLYSLNEATTTGKYSLVPGGRIHTSEKRIGGVLIKSGNYELDGETIEFWAKRIPPDKLKDLKKERELLVDTLHGFKKIRWSLDRDIKGESSVVERLKKSTAEYIKGTYQALDALSSLHHSDQNRAFCMGSPGRASISISNMHRNDLYHFVEGMVFFS